MDSIDSVGTINCGTDSDGNLKVAISGVWRASGGVPRIDSARKAVADGGVGRVRLEAEQVDGWDSALLVFVRELTALCKSAGIPLDLASLPEGAGDQRSFRPIGSGHCRGFGTLFSRATPQKQVASCPTV